MAAKKEILLGVSSSIAAYRAPDVARGLLKAGAGVTVIMTPNATKLVGPALFSALTGRETYVDLWSAPEGACRENHITLREKASLLLIAPATANVIGKLRAGIADDMLTTTALAMKSPILIAPAMNTDMFQNAAVQENIEALKKRGVRFVGPASGDLACGDTGPGRLADVDEIVSKALEAAR